ncbi:family 20 glycosylhydrolase [Nocardia sp. IFM 10818]
MRRRSLLIAAGAAALAAATRSPLAAAGPDTAAAPPRTVPEIRSWTAGPGTFAFTPETRVVTDAQLSGVAQRFADDLRAMTGTAVTVAGGGPARAGDITVRLADSAPVQPESYRIEAADHVSISARSELGVIHATQTVLQWLHQSAILPGGVAEDWPEFPLRGLLVDTGRQFFPVEWLRRRVRELAYLRMNYLHLHLSENEGFRLASDRHPEITSPQHYSKAEIADLIAYAAGYGIEIIPEIGMPGHMGAILAQHPDLQLRPATTSTADQVRDSLVGGGSAAKIDLSQPAAYELMEDLLREYLPLFPGRFWHIGGDEYLADYARYPQLGEYAIQRYGPGAHPTEVFKGYVNWADRIVRAAGKTTVMWNDGLNYPGELGIDPSIVIGFWSYGNNLPWFGPGRTAADFAAAGHRLINAAFTPTYFVTGGNAKPLSLPPEALYAWDPGLFVNGDRLPAGSAPHGSQVSIWCDDPHAMTMDQIESAARARLPIMAQKLWSSGAAVAYSDLAAQGSALARLPH